MRSAVSLIVVVAIVILGGSRAAAEGPVVVVTAYYPGASAQIVADTVAAPIEQQIIGVERAARLESESRGDGLYFALLRLKPNVDPKIVVRLVENRVALAKAVLPSAVVGGGITVEAKTAPRAENRVTITIVDRRGQGWEALRQFSEAVLKRLSADGAIVKPEVFPDLHEKALLLDIDREKCRKHNVLVTDVTSALQLAMSAIEFRNMQLLTSKALDELRDRNLRVLKGEFVRPGTPGQLTVGGRVYRVDMGPPPRIDTVKELDELKGLKVRSGKGETVPLTALASFKLSGPTGVYRVDMYPAVRITGLPPEGKTVKSAAARCVELADAEKKGQGRLTGFTVTTAESVAP
jgi:multidrug efflux pump subunit AcrB